MNRHSYGQAAYRIALVLVLLLASACHIKLVSDYDDDFVKAAAATQKEMNTLFQNLKNPPAGYDVSYKGNIAAYNKIDVDLDGILVLAMAHENNDESVKQVKAIIERFRDLEKRHDSLLGGPVTPAQKANFVTQEQRDMNQLFSVVLRTENDKKAGK